MSTYSSRDAKELTDSEAELADAQSIFDTTRIELSRSLESNQEKHLPIEEFLKGAVGEVEIKQRYETYQKAVEEQSIKLTPREYRLLIENYKNSIKSYNTHLHAAKELINYLQAHNKNLLKLENHLGYTAGMKLGLFFGVLATILVLIVFNLLRA